MNNQIEFIINRADLVEILNFLSPFIEKQKKEYIEEDDDDSEIVLPEPYFGDKVTFQLYKTYACLFVLTKEMVKVEKICNVDSNVEDVSFCMSYAYLLQEISKSGRESLRYSFKEDRFFGFNVFDTISGKHLFDVDAHSVKKQPIIQPYYYSMPDRNILEHDDLIKVLKEFPKYTNKNSINDHTGYIWFQNDDGRCKVTSCSGYALRQEVFHSEIYDTYEFSLLGKFAKRVLDMITNWTDYDEYKIYYGDSYLGIIHYGRTGIYAYYKEESIELPLCKTKLPSIKTTLEGAHSVSQTYVYLKDLQATIRMINTMKNKDDFLFIHFFQDHVNFYNINTCFEEAVYHFIDAADDDDEESDDNYAVKLHQKTFENIMEEIHTDKVIFTLVDDYLLHINNKDENFFWQTNRAICTVNLQDSDMKLLKRGDNSLKTHEVYIAKYFTKHNVEDEFSTCKYATTNEMKLEAICRMKQVIDYTDVIDYFRKTGCTLFS